MTTKHSRWDVRRRYHGEMMEGVVLASLVTENVINPIKEWDGLVRPKKGQPFFVSKDGTSECPLDEFAWVANEDRSEMRSCIVEVKAMRALDWHSWVDHGVMHQDKLAQHARHRRIAYVREFDGVALFAVNKDSSEIWIRAYSALDSLIPSFDFLY